jgi:tetratricopeptide (TPR) repeat protein
LVLFVSLVAMGMGCGYRDPILLVKDYFSFGMQGRFERQYRLLAPAVRRVESRQAFIEQQEAVAARRKLVKAELLNKPGADPMWRAYVRLTWDTGTKRQDVETRGFTVLNRSGRWWILDTPAARVEANEAYVAGDPGRATRLLQRIVRLNPMDTEALDLLGYVLRDNVALKNNLELAVEAHRRAIDLEPANADWHLSLGNDYRLIGWHEGAVTELRKAATLAPRASTFVWLGVAYAASGQVESARNAWRMALKLEPENAQAHACLEKTR